MKWLIKKLFKFYKSCIDPLLPSSCMYVPSCSAYMTQSVEKRGPIGFGAGIMRVMRCNPLAKGGFDPPKNSKRREKWVY